MADTVFIFDYFPPSRIESKNLITQIGDHARVTDREDILESIGHCYGPHYFCLYTETEKSDQRFNELVIFEIYDYLDPTGCFIDREIFIDSFSVPSEKRDYGERMYKLMDEIERRFTMDEEERLVQSPKNYRKSIPVRFITFVYPLNGNHTLEPLEDRGWYGYTELVARDHLRTFIPRTRNFHVDKYYIKHSEFIF